MLEMQIADCGRQGPACLGRRAPCLMVILANGQDARWCHTQDRRATNRRDQARKRALFRLRKILAQSRALRASDGDNWH